MLLIHLPGGIAAIEDAAVVLPGLGEVEHNAYQQHKGYTVERGRRAAAIVKHAGQRV